MDTNIDSPTAASAEKLLQSLRSCGWVIGCAESCTGGLLCGALTDIAGYSDVFVLGHVTYANAAKERILGITPQLLARYGAVSAPVADAMACSVAQQATWIGKATALGIATTGISGPGSDGSEKPVGQVYVGVFATNWATAQVQEYQFSGDRYAVRQKTLIAALDFALKSLQKIEQRIMP